MLFLYYILLIALFSITTIINADYINYYLYTNKSPEKKIILTPYNLKEIDPNTSLKIIIHGWGESPDRKYYQEMTDAYFKKGKYNVIQFDWKRPAQKSYIEASNNTLKIGELLGMFITLIEGIASVPLQNVHLIGHSLGGHVAGFAGKTVFKIRKRKLGRITGLDPAGPGFRDKSRTQRLNKDDADFVDITHTDSTNFGIGESVGTVDFFPNGGKSIQPGCELYSIEFQQLNVLEKVFCSHIRSHAYFIYSINNPDIIAKKCESYIDFTLDNCRKGSHIVYGEDVPLDAKGDYYFKTKSSKPFSFP